MTATCYLCGRPITGKICEVPLPRVGSFACVCSECAKGAKECQE